MKITYKQAARQSNEIRILLEKNQKAMLKKIKKEYPDLIREMRKHWDIVNSDLTDPTYYYGLAEAIHSNRDFE